MTIDVAFSLNQGIVVGLLTAMNSVVKNAPEPHQIRFNIAVPPQEVALFEEHINRCFPDPAFQWRLGTFTPPDFLQSYLNHKFKPKTVARTRSRYMQYARLFLKDIFPDLGKVIYLDSDVLVLGDVAHLFHTYPLTPELYFAAVPHFFPGIFYFGKPLKGFKEALKFEKTFNSGVILTDFRYWDEATYQRLHDYLHWDTRENYRLFNLGDETVLNLMFKHYLPLRSSWNRCGYGNARLYAWLLKQPLAKTDIIHWSGGHHKPWKTKNIVYGNLWWSYVPPSFEGNSLHG